MSFLLTTEPWIPCRMPDGTHRELGLVDVLVGAHEIEGVHDSSPPVTLAAHRPPRGEGVKRSDPHPEEKAIVEAAPETTLYVAALKQKGRKVVVLALRQLLRLLREYPREPFLAAVREAAQYGLYDLDRLERMILRRVARDYFLLLDTDTDPHD